MHGDFTRLTFKPKKRYHKVLMQQGRVQLDQDWNEQVEILAHRWHMQTLDMIGQSGAPQNNPGFGITWDGDAGKLLISPGRLYTGSLLCEAFATDGSPLNINDQPFLTHPDAGFQTPAPGVTRTDLVYLKAWERHISAVEDLDLLEPALGGLDTTTRSQTIWQVHTITVPSGTRPDTNLAPWNQLTAAPTGSLSTRSLPGDSDTTEQPDPCRMEDMGGYRGLENRLYRVEVHAGGDRSTARFKWSRDNGSVTVRIEDVRGKTVQVSSLGRDRYSEFAVDQWVEVINDAAEWMDGRGILTRVTAVNETERLVELADDVSALAGHSPRLRRWDMVGTEGALPLSSDWLELESGVQVKFGEGTYRVGDYWVFHARSVNASVQELTDAPRMGPAPQYYRLALVTWKWVPDANNIQQLFPTIEECRHIFPALTTPAPEPPPAVPYVHVPAGPDFGKRLEQAIMNLPASGGCITLPSGHHVLERPISFNGRNRVAIIGTGYTRIHYDTATDVAAFSVSNSKGWRFHGLTLVTRGTHIAMYFGYTNDQLQITDCRIINLNHEGMAIWMQQVGGLQMTNTVLLAAVGMYSRGNFMRATISQCQFHCLRAGMLLPRIENLTLTATHITGFQPFSTFMTPPILNAYVVESLEQMLDSGTGISPAMVPVGIRSGYLSGCRMEQCTFQAGVGVTSLQAFRLELESCSFTTRVALAIYLESDNCTVEGSTINAYTAGILVFGKALQWRIADNQLSTTTTNPLRSVVVGQPGWDRRFWRQTTAAILLGGNQYTSPIDTIATEHASYLNAQSPVLPASSWLDPLVSLTNFDDPLLHHGAVIDSIRIHNNQMGGLHLTGEINAYNIHITGNRIQTDWRPGVWLQATSNDRAFQVEHNTVRGCPALLAETTAVHADHNAFDRHSTATLSPTVITTVRETALTSQMGSALEDRNGREFLNLGQNLLRRLETGQVTAAEVATALDAIAAVAPDTDKSKSMLQAAVTALQASPVRLEDASLLMKEWLIRWAMTTEQAASIVAASGSRLTANRIVGHHGGWAGILLDKPAEGGTAELQNIHVEGNTFTNFEEGAVLSRVPVRSTRILSNDVRKSNGFNLIAAEDVVVQGNTIVLLETYNMSFPRVGITLKGVQGSVRVSDNQVTEVQPHWDTAYFGLTVSGGSDAALMVTGNHFLASVRQHVRIDLPGGTVVFSQNMLELLHPAQPTISVFIPAAGRFAAIGNIWKEYSTVVPLQLQDVKAYTLLGNIGSYWKDLPPVDKVDGQTQHNVKPDSLHPDDPILLVDWPAQEQTINAEGTIKGLAVDRLSPNTAAPGVSSVQVFLDGPEGHGEDLGYATLGLAHSKDSWYGTQFTNKGGWELLLKTDNLSFGPHRLYVYAKSAETGARSVVVRPFHVQAKYSSDPTVGLLQPLSGGSLTVPGLLKGWAVDKNAPHGSGVDEVHVYRGGVRGAGGTWVGKAKMGVRRTDVPEGDPLQYSGWELAWPGNLTGTHMLYIYARSIRGGWWRHYTFSITTVQGDSNPEEYPEM